MPHASSPSTGSTDGAYSRLPSDKRDEKQVENPNYLHPAIVRLATWQDTSRS